MYKSVNETALMFGVKPLTVRRWIKEGKIKAIKVVGSVRIPEEELEKFMKGE